MGHFRFLDIEPYNRQPAILSVVIESPIACIADACCGVVHRVNGVMQHGTLISDQWNQMIVELVD